jgi:hypothetical protein
MLFLYCEKIPGETFGKTKRKEIKMEAGFEVLLVLISVAVGVVIGFLIGKTQAERRYLRDTRYTKGTLNVDCSELEFEPGLFLGLSVPVESVVSQKYITLDINVLSSDSRQ